MYQLTGSFYNNNNKTHTKTGLSLKHLGCFSTIASGRVSQPWCYWLWVDKAYFVLCTIRQLPVLLLASTYYMIAVPHVDLVKCLLERESICPVETIGLRVLPGEAVFRKGKSNSQNVLKFSFFHRPRLELAGRISLRSFLRSDLRSFIGKGNIVPWIDHQADRKSDHALKMYLPANRLNPYSGFWPLSKISGLAFWLSWPIFGSLGRISHLLTTHMRMVASAFLTDCILHSDENNGNWISVFRTNLN